MNLVAANGRTHESMFWNIEQTGQTKHKKQGTALNCSATTMKNNYETGTLAATWTEKFTAYDILSHEPYFCRVSRNVTRRSNNHDGSLVSDALRPGRRLGRYF